MKARRLSLPQRNRWLWLMPSVSVLLFVAALLSFLWLLHANEQEKRRDALIEDVLWLEQAIRLQLQTNQHTLENLARQIAAGGMDDIKFRSNIRILAATSAEVTAAAQLDVQGRVERQMPIDAMAPALFSQSDLVDTRQRTLRTALPNYSPVVYSPNGSPAVILFTPIIDTGRVVGLLTVRYSLKSLLQNLVPWWIAKRYQISITDIEGRLIASKVDLNLERSDDFHVINFDAFGYTLKLRADNYKRGSGILGQALPVTLIGLSLLMLASLWSLRQHMRERLAVEQRLKRETAWRQAMEDSMRTGMTALDRHGRITYVNRAFCELIGYHERELVGAEPPLPYWPPEDAKQCADSLNAVLRGDVSSTGYTTRMMHKNGNRIDVRVYSSPLIDADGRHVGWVGSLYDITELKREREALRASQQRFVTLLNGLDAAVSVSQVSSGQLLMCNQPFRNVFGLADDGPPLCALPMVPFPQAEAADIEVYHAPSQRWYHMHRRKSAWVDGAEVWLDIAADITETRHAADLERQQAEKLQQTARLISMGEIASSLAHELNQPLSAIASYSTGGLNVLEHDKPSMGMLRQAFTKIGEQAKRAGQIIRGIREFVQKREPHRSRCDFAEMLDTVLGLLTAELRKSSVKLSVERPNAAVAVMADRVMLEQVLFNLIKNGIEAMADTPARQRRLAVRYRLDEGRVAVRIEDSGPGIGEADVARLFMPFYSTKSEGMGMGLNICRSIVESHHGHLWFEAAATGGACFCFTLPVIVEKEPAHVE
ncbi:PAS domain S-box protein [Chitinivorax sp. PXF-14]|uniref:PAS domain-containing sensor histidine kinase n=1 Tax=Chitinivorax sp. PXF-14 TaxID=3230488 RepID=UPI003466B37F